MSKRTYSGVAKHPQPSKRYASDSTDKEWAIIASELVQAEGSGRKRTVDLREMNAIFCRTRTGCQWLMLPKEFPD
ncbi:MAG: transposase [Anaerolineae bacterium]